MTNRSPKGTLRKEGVSICCLAAVLFVPITYGASIGEGQEDPAVRCLSLSAREELEVGSSPQMSPLGAINPQLPRAPVRGTE